MNQKNPDCDQFADHRERKMRQRVPLVYNLLCRHDEHRDQPVGKREQSRRLLRHQILHGPEHETSQQCRIALGGLLLGPSRIAAYHGMLGPAD